MQTYIYKPLKLNTMKTNKIQNQTNISTINYASNYLLGSNIPSLIQSQISSNTIETDDMGTVETLEIQYKGINHLNEILELFLTHHINYATSLIHDCHDDDYFDYIPAYIEQIAQLILLLYKKYHYYPEIQQTLEHAVIQFNQGLLETYKSEPSYEDNYTEDGLQLDQDPKNWAQDYGDNDIYIK